MRMLLMFILLCAFRNAHAQCEVKELRIEIRDARKQMKPEEYEAHLLSIKDVKKYSEHCKQAIISEALSSYYVDRDVDKAIKYREAAGYSYGAGGDEVRAIFCTQNIGFIYEERKHDIENASKYIMLALRNWEKLNDTTQQANLNKYLGYLEGKIGNYASGKKYVQKAISQFQSVNNENGVAVCNFDMGAIYFEEKKYDSAIVKFNKANTYWKQSDNADRMIGINNYLLRIYSLKKDKVKAAQFITDNEALLSDKTYWEDKLKFYMYARQHKPLYETKYSNMNDSLIKAGVKTH